jgi:hypothetical protein
LIVDLLGDNYSPLDDPEGEIKYFRMAPPEFQPMRLQFRTQSPQQLGSFMLHSA